MHNNIMAAGSRDRPPMLATGRYAQWRSRFLRYIDTRPNGDALRKCILTDNGQGMLTPLALVATAQTFQTLITNIKISQIIKNQHPSFTPTSSHATTKTQRQSDSKQSHNHRVASEEDSDPEQAQKDKEMQKNLALIAKYDNRLGQFWDIEEWTVVGARETVDGSSCASSGIQCFNCKDLVIIYKGKKIAKPITPPSESDSKEEDNDEQELGAHYNYIAKIQEVPNEDSGTDAEPLEQDDQNDAECDNERAALANLIANLKLDVDNNKKIQKQLKKANATLAQELTKCKSILAETSRTLGESNSIRDSCLVALQNKHTEFERYKAFNDRTVDYDKLEHKLNATPGQLAQKEIDIKEGLKVKAYEISVVKEKH
ncbi:hypothetical protein Tco_1304965, partial [Tanacetum coccineum]